jgi:proteic killer suppression protein
MRRSLVVGRNCPAADGVIVSMFPVGSFQLALDIYDGWRYGRWRMIRSFACRETEKLFNDESSRRLPMQIQRVARRKLMVLNQARSLNDLRVPYGNHLEALKDDRKGQHSIRINDQWRICFRWHGEDALAVEIVDYH